MSSGRALPSLINNATTVDKDQLCQTTTLSPKKLAATTGNYLEKRTQNRGPFSKTYVRVGSVIVPTICMQTEHIVQTVLHATHSDSKRDWKRNRRKERN